MTDYDVGGTKLWYSSAEIFAWQKYEDYSTLVVYGALDEQHEIAFKTSKKPSVVEGSGITMAQKKGAWVLNFQNSKTRRVVQVGKLNVYIVGEYLNTSIICNDES